VGWIVLVAAAQAYVVAWLALTAVACRLWGAPARRVSLGVGPTRAVGRIGGTELRVGALPLGGWVDRGDDLSSEGPTLTLPGPLHVLPHLVLWLGAAVLAPPELTRSIVAWIGGWIGLGEVRLGLIHGLARAAAVAAERPVASALGVATVLGALNVAQGATTWAGRSSAWLQGVGTLGWLALVLALFGRGLWLDL
jgi:membrane-associated protease RseP (regulator of RpoE activity)